MASQIKHKISFCTVCMNRLHHLKHTLIKNIKDNLSYENVEFIILNYNSRDGMDDWMRIEMKEYIESGIVKYYKTNEPDSFHMSHSKNVVSKCAEGDIICNVDADNYLGVGFAEYINQKFNKHNNIYMTVNRSNSQKDFFGRICYLKKDFLTLTGYDETMKGYGFEDFDFCNRLELLGRKVKYIDNINFLNAITHSDVDRLSNEFNKKSMNQIYIRYINHAISEFLYLFQKHDSYMGKIIINKLFNSNSINNLFNKHDKFQYTNSLYNDIWIKGIWSPTDKGIDLMNNDNSKLEFKFENENELKAVNTFSNKKFHKIIDDKRISRAVMFFSQMNNRLILEDNKKKQILAVNKLTFGETTLI